MRRFISILLLIAMMCLLMSTVFAGSPTPEKFPNAVKGGNIILSKNMARSMIAMRL